MEYKLISEVNFSEHINGRVFVRFLAKDVNVAPQKNGQMYISVTMKHRDFELNGKLFGASQQYIDMVKAGGVYNASLDIKPYAKSDTGWACTIYNIEPCTTSSPAEFVEWAEGMQEAQDTINKALVEISESEYGDIVYPILVEHWEKFAYWTAASGMHHNILGGLFVHTAEVIAQCEILADYWNNKYSPKFINKPLLLSAALLHDLAKTTELNVEMASGATEYSVHSSLSTHIMDILTWVTIQAYKISFGKQYTEYQLAEGKEPKTQEQINEEIENLELLKHCLAAHHGKLEYGSPIVASVPEAIILNMADNMSAEMYKFNKNFKKMEAGTSSHIWHGGTCVVTYKSTNNES